MCSCVCVCVLNKEQDTVSSSLDQLESPVKYGVISFSATRAIKFYPSIILRTNHYEKVQGFQGEVICPLTSSLRLWSLCCYTQALPSSDFPSYVFIGYHFQSQVLEKYGQENNFVNFYFSAKNFLSSQGQFNVES